MNLSFESILNIIYLVGAIQGIVLSVFLINSKVNVISNRLLGILTLFWAVILIIFSLQSDGLFIKYPHLLKTLTHVEYTFLPLLYLSVKYLVTSHKTFEKRDLIHFVPLLFNILLYSGFYFNSAAEKLQMARSNEGYYHIASIISDEILTLQGIIYPILALMLIRNYNNKLPDYQSNIDVTVIKGMKIGIILIFLSWITGAVGAHLSIFNINIGVDLFLFVYLFLVFIIYVLSYVALRSPETFKLSERQIVPVQQKLRPFQDLTLDAQENNLEIERSSSNGDFIDYDDELNIKLIEFMDQEKPFLNPELSLQELAGKLNVSRHQLSAAINKQQNMNFYVFVNKYRVGEVKKLMTNPENKNFKIISLAYDAGFNSKASFNRIFKQLAGITPSEYMMGGAQA